MRTATILLLAIVPTPLLAQAYSGLYVGNQGQFGADTGSVTFFDPATEEAAEVLGDVGTLVQGLLLYGGAVYVAANTAGAVDVLDAQTQARVARITDTPNPRYLAAVGGKGYVTDLYGNQVIIFDLEARAAVGAIPVGSNPEDIERAAGKLFVANSGFGADSTLTVIDPAAGAATGTVDLGCDGPRHLLVDAEAELWAFCIGNTVYNDDFTEIIEQTNGAVVVVDPVTETVLDRIDLDVQVGAAGLGQGASYADGEAFLIHGTDVLVFDTATNALAETITLAGDDPVGAVLYEPATERLYAGRVPGFDVEGYVSVHDRTGAEVGRFAAGVAPTYLLPVIEGVDTAAEEAPVVPKQIALGAPYPNPFNPQATIPYEVRVPARVTLTVHDALGRTVATLVDEVRAPGTYTASFSGAGLASGVYTARLATAGRATTRRLVLLK